jgi:hypothetical protein
VARDSATALGADVKQAPVTISNHGSSKPSEVKIKIKVEADADLRGKAAVDLGGNAGRFCELDDQGRAECLLDKSIIPAPGGSVGLYAFLRKAGPATGRAGKLTVSVEVAGDSAAENDSDTVDVTFSQNEGPDLTAFAEDVTLHDGDVYTGKPIPAGGRSVALGFVYNFGDRTAGGFTALANLPEGVTFAGQKAGGCDFSADRRSVRCEVRADQLTLPPRTGAVVQLDVVVARDAKGPATLPDGSWTFVAREAVDPERARIAATRPLPDHVFKVGPAEIARLDIDPSDNVDGFAVLVAGPAGGTGDGNGDGSGTGGPDRG